MSHLEQLIKIYNTLGLVSTKGEDTIMMGQCLSTFRTVLMEMQETVAAKASETNETDSN